MNETKDQNQSWVDCGNGVDRRVRAENPDLMVVEFRFATGGNGALHSHPHTQSTYVSSGVFDFTIDGETRRISAGDCFVIPSNAEHGCQCIEAGLLVDCFTPRRDDFL
ncbi:cupin domain-containing protein [Pelagimonas varians]|uniref:Cupin domain protein n=1 Tax=Pelagimonas varians TaxID=696760 RepID=A0A238KN08_9RHOB|nr:cupin domain-containing protein [Pelagimonas varians]PYG28925.1 Cupin domain-containing protein [Pelagimonas varians]SMX44098.1 Cupin domain protein [Pelagimonas varians]